MPRQDKGASRAARGAHENLIAAMITGRKHGAPQDGIARPWRALTVLMLAVVFGYWSLQWKYAVATPGTPPTAQRADPASTIATTRRPLPDPSAA
ncbi:MAG: hypothetical protein Q8R69_16155 [Telluria sp.]|nr:hypothetical protein [Telluria sp.]